jgi:uncharacterized membrane protein YqjE
MGYERLRSTALPHALQSFLGDFADLVGKEVRLAKAEMSEKLSHKRRAAIWLGLAAFMGLLASMALIQAIALGIAALGLHLGWASLIVAAGLIGLAIAFYFAGKADAAESLAPTRTIDQIKRDISLAKEQLS